MAQEEYQLNSRYKTENDLIKGESLKETQKVKSFPRQAHDTEDTAFVSLVMPIRNEEAYIHQSLDSVILQDYPADRMEVLVIDGMSTDRTREIIKEYQQKYPNIRLIDNPGLIVPKGLNLAIHQAKGDIIVRVDGHCIIQKDYVRLCVQYLSQEGIYGVGGPMETIGETPLSDVIALAMSSTFGVGGSAFRTVKNRTMFVDTVAFPAYRKEILLKAGLFDEELVRNQDDEYNFRLREMGGKILLSSNIRSRYFSRSSFSSLFKQYYQYGFWKVRVMQKHPQQMSLRQFIPPVFVTTLIGLSVLSLFSSFFRYLLLAEVGMYGIANLGAAVTTARGRPFKTIPQLMVAFSILHVSYGLGFLNGLIKFANRWKTNTNHA